MPLFTPNRGSTNHISFRPKRKEKESQFQMKCNKTLDTSSLKKHLEIQEQSITEVAKIHDNKKIMVNQVLSGLFGKENP